MIVKQRLYYGSVKLKMWVQSLSQGIIERWTYHHFYSKKIYQTFLMKLITRKYQKLNVFIYTQSVRLLKKVINHPIMSTK